MKNKITIMASNGGIFNAYKVFNMAISAAIMNKEVNMFFNFEAIRFVTKLEYYNILDTETVELNKRIKDNGVTPINELIRTCKKLGVKFFAIPYGMKVMNIKENQLLEETILASETTFLDYAQDSTLVLNF